jgi:hypothetical protein
MTVSKVKDFTFKSGPITKNFAMGGGANCYAKGGSAKAGQSVQMAKSNAVAKTLVGQKMTPMAKGGKVSEAPRMMRKEVVMRETVKAPSAPQGMIKSRGALGVIANKNPGETRMNTAPNLPGEKMMSKGGKMGKSNC